MTSRCSWLCGLALVLLTAVPRAVPDSTSYGSIEGVVSDPSGAVVPGAAIRIRPLATAATLTTTTNGQGLFWFPVVPTGAYDLAVEKGGFATWTQKDISVTVGARVNLAVSLVVAIAEQRTTVSSEPPLLESTRSQVSTTIDSRVITDLPVNGRSFVDLILLTPGVTRSPGGGYGVGPSFEGQRQMYLLLVDGIDNNNTFFGEALGFGVGHN